VKSEETKPKETKPVILSPQAVGDRGFLTRIWCVTSIEIYSGYCGRQGQDPEPPHDYFCVTLKLGAPSYSEIAFSAQTGFDAAFAKAAAYTVRRLEKIRQAELDKSLVDGVVSAKMHALEHMECACHDCTVGLVIDLCSIARVKKLVVKRLAKLQRYMRNPDDKEVEKR